MGYWFSGAVIWKKEGGVVYLLLQDSRSTHPRYADHATQTKFPGGSKKRKDTTQLETCDREVKEETSLRRKQGSPIEQIDHFARGIEQFFFLASFDSYEGELRTEVMVDGFDILSPPRFVPINQVGGMLYETHQRSFLKVLKHFGLMG